MKIRISELRKIVREELQLQEAMLSQNLQTGVQQLTRSFPNALKNQLITQKMGVSGANNRAYQAAADQVADYVNQVSTKFQQDLENMLQKHFADAVSGFKPPAQVAQPEEQPAETGTAPDQRRTIMPPAA